MILFVPAYDSQTRGNLSIALAIADNSCQFFFQDDALGEKLKNRLRRSPAPLFVMSHGTANCFFEQNGKPALLPDEVHLLANLPVFVFACYTSNEFGKSAAQEKAIYWGYTGAIQSVDLSDTVSVLFRPIFKTILYNFPHHHEASAIQTFLLHLKSACDQVAEALDLLDELDDPLGAYACGRDIWSKLRIHHPDLTDPIFHPESPLGDLFEWR
ncbi:MAG: hypothetical protein ACKVUS_02730 [Saprospiraceae bacterium]